MATRQYKAMATDEAITGVVGSLARLGDLLQIEIAPMPERIRDPEMSALLQMQAIRANLDRIEDVIEAMLMPPADIDSDLEVEPDGTPDDQPPAAPTDGERPPHDEDELPPPPADGDPDLTPTPDDPGESDDPAAEDDGPVEFGVADPQGLAAIERQMKRTGKAKKGK